MLTQIVLPAALATIMFGIGLSLQTKDFVLLRDTPRPVFAGLFGQLLLMPLIALTIVWSLPVSQGIALGVLLLAACPGGTMSNAISQVVRGDLALSVSLTVASTLLCIFTTPLLLGITFSLFSDDAALSSAQMWSISIRLLIIALLPVVAGMLFRRYFPVTAMSVLPIFQRFALIFLCLLIAVMVWREFETLIQAPRALFVCIVLLSILSSGAGYTIGVLCKLPEQVCKTLCIETGIQNAAMAMVIAITILEKPALSIVAAVYGLFMYAGPLIVILIAPKIFSKSLQGDTPSTPNNW